MSPTNDKRIAGYRDLERYAVENGATMPLLQSVVTVVAQEEAGLHEYGNGWLLPQDLAVELIPRLRAL